MTDSNNQNSDDSKFESDSLDDHVSTAEELTAYLDGELGPEAIERVELRLGTDPDYLAELQALQNTWDLLDTIPLAEPGVSFTKTTMELVVGEAFKSAKQKQSRSWVWPLRIAIMLAIPALLFAVVFALVRNLQTKPDRILIENLSVIENQPRYDAITYDMDFLELLNKRELFADSKVVINDQGEFNVIESSNEVQSVPATPELRQEFVENLDVQQRVKLKRKLDDYLKLTPAAIEKAKQFDAALNAKPNSAQLNSTLMAYYNWLLVIDSGKKSRLRDMSSEARVDAIASIRHEQALEEFGNDAISKLASPDDAAPILAWCEIVFNWNESKIRNRFPKALSSYLRSVNRSSPPSEIVRRKAKSSSLPDLIDFLIRVDQDWVEDLMLGDRDTKMLYDLLSTKAQFQMDERSASERNDLVLSWVESAIQSKRQVSIKVLNEFERSLPEKERDMLKKMSREDYQSTLKQMFLKRRKGPRQRNRFERDLESLMDF